MLLTLNQQTGWDDGGTWSYRNILNSFKHVSSLLGSELQSRYLPSAAHHLSYKYKKAVYVEYTDKSFTQRKNTADSLLGPLLKGTPTNQIHVS